MKIYSTAAHNPLTEHLDTIKKSSKPSTWRCLTTKLSKELYYDPYAQRIALNFIEENYNDFEAYEFSFYWLKTGHIFLLFQGRMQKVHETFENFLSFVSENDKATRPVFEAHDMGQQFEQIEAILGEALEDIEAIKLPMAIKHIQPEKIPAQNDNTAKLKKVRSLRMKPLLLVVEDERMTQAFIASLLENYCDVVVAETVEEGRTLYKELWPDLVFMDIMLPDGDGQDLTEELMALDPDAYIIMVSGQTSDDKIFHCKILGAKGFVVKPVVHNKSRLMQQVFDYNNYKRNAISRMSF